MYTVYHTQYIALYTLYAVQFKELQCTLYTVTMYSIKCTISVQCTVYSVHCTVYTVTGRPDMATLDEQNLRGVRGPDTRRERDTGGTRLKMGNSDA